MITHNGPIRTSASGEELWSHGTAAFPCGCYRTDLHVDEVPWHWHAEYEFGLCFEGLIAYRAGGERLLLHAGDAVFVNGGIPHTEVPATGPEEPCEEGSLVCRPSMLYGSRESSIYLDCFRRFEEPSAPQVVYLPAAGEPWQREAAAAAHRAHAAVATDEAVSAIARHVGFPSHSHFARRFRERYGHTPAEHRNR